MTDPFQPGDIAIAQHFDNFPEFNGRECEVINGLEFRGMIEGDMTIRENVLRYRVRFPCGQVLGPRPGQLRRKVDPVRDEAVEREAEV